MGSLMGNKNLQRNSFVVLSIIFLLFSHNSAHAQDIIDCSPVATNTAASPIIKKTAGSTARSGSTLKKIVVHKRITPKIKPISAPWLHLSAIARPTL